MQIEMVSGIRLFILLTLFNATISTETFDQCKRCKLLSYSFDHWLQKTTRGNFEGGNTAWEESKLKTYANSEIRLAEIQEGLCSELKNNQDYCYALAEEADPLIESWWFNQVQDLHTFLCIDSLKYCCPKNHFGYNCQPCPTEAGSTHVCSGHGKCNGDGTREGDGLCKCDIGFNGTSCEICARNYYKISPDQCRSCHVSCDECNGQGADMCAACKAGWSLRDNMCEDINECADTDACASNEYCVNKEGSYLCVQCDRTCLACAGAGEYNCTLCPNNNYLWNGLCVDNYLQSNLIASVFKRIALYSALLIIVLAMLKYSKTAVSIGIIFMSVLIYYFESNSKINTIDVIYNYVKL